jgi:hypothetical protein
MDIEERLAELQEEGASLDDAVRQIFREDYSANIKELMRLTGKNATYIGRLKGQVSRTHSRGVSPSKGQIETHEMTPPIVMEFKAAIDDLLERSTPRFREHLAILFQRQSENLIKNRESFENFLLRNGLTPVQSNGIIERIMAPSGQRPLGQDIVQTFQMPGGGFFHILQPQGQPQGQPIILQSPGGGQPQGAEQSRLESRLERLEQAITSMVNSGGREPPMRRGRRVVLDRDGNVVTDAEGNIIYEQYEEPWEPGAKDTLTETLLPLLVRQALDGQRKEINEETLALKIKDRLAPQESQGGITVDAIRNAIHAEVSEVKRDLDAMKEDQAKRDRQEEVDRAVARATAEHREIIAGLSTQLGERGGYQGLSDTQAAMRYQKDLVDGMVDAVGKQVSMVREDIRPLILQQAVQSMKTQGLSDETIGQFLSSVRQHIPATGAIPERSKEEAVERVKKWAKT